MIEHKEFFNNTQKFFNENNWVIIKGHLTKELSTLCYAYCLNKVKSIDHKSTFRPDLYNKHWDGGFGEEQVPKAYWSYGDVLMDSILETSTISIGKYLGMNLVPTYSYWRLYEKGQELEKHLDRKSCEFSATLCLGYNANNLKDPYVWPIYLENKYEKSVEVLLEPGDLLLYKGTELAHWRKPYKGLNHAQVFLHYNKLDDKESLPLDGRPILAIPKQDNK